MAVSGKICWAVLERMKGQSVALAGSLPGGTPAPLVNAVAIAALQKELMEQHCRQDVDDSLAFLEKRGYLEAPRMTYSLTEKALRALETGAFSKDEEPAFSAALIDLHKAGGRNFTFGLRAVIQRFIKWRIKK